MSSIVRLPVIAGVEITTDAQGRFGLNALHRASGNHSCSGQAQMGTHPGFYDLPKIIRSN